jgi:hypothetical protein
METAKRPFLVAYDYGMGGLWGVMYARSAEEIHTAYPELVIIDTPPVWMDTEELQHLQDSPYDIDGAPWGILNAVLDDRSK